MKRDTELRERRNKAIFARFNDLLKNGETHEAIYCQLEDEFYISSITIKQIVLRITRTHGKLYREYMKLTISNARIYTAIAYCDSHFGKVATPFMAFLTAFCALLRRSAARFFTILYHFSSIIIYLPFSEVLTYHKSIILQSFIVVFFMFIILILPSSQYIWRRDTASCKNFQISFWLICNTFCQEFLIVN